MADWTFTAEDWSAIGLSVKVSLTAVIVSLPVGMAVAWMLARKKFRGKWLVETLINLPLVLPPVVTGYLLLVALGRRGLLGRWLDHYLGLQLVFDWKGAAVASAVMAFPLMVRAMRLAFSAVDPRLEQAARTLGAGPWDTFFRITLPLARNGVIAGAILAFARALGEFGATIMIAGDTPGETRTVPLAIYDLLNSPNADAHVWRLLLASIAIAASTMAAGEYLQRRGAEDSAAS